MCISVVPLKLWRMHLDCDSLLECFCQCREKIEILISALERCQLPVTLTSWQLCLVHTKGYKLEWGCGHSPAGVASAMLSGGERSSPSTSWTLPCAAQDTIHPICSEGRVLTHFSERGWVWQVCELAGQKCRWDRRWDTAFSDVSEAFASISSRFNIQ